MIVLFLSLVTHLPVHTFLCVWGPRYCRSSRSNILQASQKKIHKNLLLTRIILILKASLVWIFQLFPDSPFLPSLLTPRRDSSEASTLCSLIDEDISSLKLCLDGPCPQPSLCLLEHLLLFNSTDIKLIYVLITCLSLL